MIITKGDWIKEWENKSREVIWNAVQRDRKKEEYKARGGQSEKT